ncbi:MAG TPA: hypothetical protein VGK01_11865 [Candidatus Angelobacter sp.]|jgi:hypothetical protein
MGVIDSFKEIADLVKKAGDIDLWRKIVQAESEVVELNRTLRITEEKVRELENLLRFKQKLSYNEPFFFVEGDPVPYCPSCWESAAIPVHMIIKLRTAATIGRECPKCKLTITTDHAGSPGHGVKGWDAL